MKRKRGKRRRCRVCGKMTDNKHHFWTDHSVKKIKFARKLKMHVCEHPCHQGFHVHVRKNGCPENCSTPCKFERICCWLYEAVSRGNAA